MLRRLIKTAAARAICSAGADRLALRRRWNGDHPVIIAYHRVVLDFDRSVKGSLPAMLISKRMLARHLDWLSERFDLVSIDDPRAWESRGRGKRPAAAVTFDDGYADFHQHAFPLLRARGIPAAVFVVTGLVGTRRMQTHDALFLALERFLRGPRTRPRDLELLLERMGVDRPEMAGLVGRLRSAGAATPALLTSLSLDRIERVIEELDGDRSLRGRSFDPYAPLDWGMISEMGRAGITVGSHSARHAILTNEDARTVRREALESRLALESRTGAAVRHFAYPAGRFDPVAVEAVAEADYEWAYTICRHRAPGYPSLTIPRAVFWERTCLDALDRFSPAVMQCQIAGVFDFMRRCGSHARRRIEEASGPAPSSRRAAS